MLGEAFIILVIFVATAITDLLVPMPFRVESWRTYTGEQATRVGRVMDRRWWVGAPMLVVTGVVVGLARHAIRVRRGGAAGT